MRPTQQTITDLGILTLGLITAVILVRSHRPPFIPSAPSIPASVKTLIDQSSDPIALVQGGKKFAAQGDLAAAAESFKKATRLDPQWRDAFLFLGQVYIGLAEANFPVVTGDLDWWQKAEFALVRAKNLDPLHKPTYDQLTIVYERTNNVEKLTELKSVLKNLSNLN